ETRGWGDDDSHFRRRYPNYQLPITNYQFHIFNLKLLFNKIEIDSKVGERQIAVDPNQLKSLPNCIFFAKACGNQYKMLGVWFQNG
ncbi:hypothetical protein, partial [Plectonema radiosum]|uniref:hypothetical protein n=1 Tax=Plectonema radiosum TaxID=945768 RepID=UPI001D13D0E9